MTDVPRVELAPGYSVASIINGCWQLAPDHGGGPASKTNIGNRFSELVDCGFTTFDCADIYAGSEEILGEFRRSRADRDNIQIHTKFVPNKRSLRQLDDRKIDEAIDLSRKKLGVDQLDLVQFHWWDYAVPGLSRMYDRLLNAQSAGKIRYLGGTNFNTEQLSGLVERDAAIVSMQSQYSLLDRRPAKLLSAFCVEKHIGLLSYGVLAGGFLTEKYLGKPPPTDPNRSLQKYRLIIDDAGGWEQFQALLTLLADIAKKHDARIQAIAARWVLDQPGVAAVVLGIGSESRIVENQAVASILLDPVDEQRIREQLDSLREPAGDPYDIERNMTSEHSKIIKTELQDAPSR